MRSKQRQLFQGKNDMAVSFDHVVPWGRLCREYELMFALTRQDLSDGVLDCGGGPARSHRGLIGLVQFEEILVGLSLRSGAFLERFRKALLHEDLERGAAPIRIEKIRGQHGVKSGPCRRDPVLAQRQPDNLVIMDIEFHASRLNHWLQGFQLGPCRDINRLSSRQTYTDSH